MPLFGKGDDQTDPATQNRIDWVNNAPPAELAAELMPMFADCDEVDQQDLVNWLFRDIDRRRFDGLVRDLKGPILEALQVLEHAELLYLSYVSDSDTRHWHVSRLGSQLLDEGQAAIRQRIEARTGI